MEKFAIGMLVGALGGALLTANNYKMRMLVKKGQEEVQAKLDKLMDEKLQELEEGKEELTSKAEETAKNVKTKAKAAGKAVKQTMQKATENSEK